MKQLNERQISILENTPTAKGVSSSDILKIINKKVSLITIKRDLDYLCELKYLERIGMGRSTVYKKTVLGMVLSPINSFKYNEADPDTRSGSSDFNFSLFSEFLINIFSKQEIEDLDGATAKYQQRIKNITPTIQSKELERFIIELSWKSSKIEGNTYTLLDTEKLISEGISAKGHSVNEATMILNHKKAFIFIMQNVQELRKNGITVGFIEKIHELLIFDLGVSRGIRKSLVGITGSKYRPLDNKYQINEALESLCKLINKMENIYSKALTILAGISYIQPFEDGNKRTARLLCNAILLSKNCAPLSYRSVVENNYREAVLVFYEKNSIVPIKKIFIEQYIFSTENYLIK